MKTESTFQNVPGRKLCAVADAPHPLTVRLDVALDVGTGKECIVAQCTESVSIVSKPERGVVSAAECAAQASAILHILHQTA